MPTDKLTDVQLQTRDDRQNIMENKCRPTNSQMYNGKRGRGAPTELTKIKLTHMKVPKHNQNEAQKITIANACTRFKLSANTSDTVPKNCVIRLN